MESGTKRQINVDRLRADLAAAGVELLSATALPTGFVSSTPRGTLLPLASAAPSSVPSLPPRPCTASFPRFRPRSTTKQTRTGKAHSRCNSFLSLRTELSSHP